MPRIKPAKPAPELFVSPPPLDPPFASGGPATVQPADRAGGSTSPKPAKAKATEVVKHEPAPPPPAVADPFVAMIREVALTPGLDVAKLDALLAMQERITDRQNKAAFDLAMAVMQPKLPVIARNGLIEIRKKDGAGERSGAVQQSTRYAKWEDINEAIVPVLGEHGFALTFRTGKAEGGQLIITGILAGHGHREQTTLELMHESSGSKNAVQAVGSSLSYGKRYVAGYLLNITTRDEDDDGKEGGGRPKVVGDPVSSEQLQQLIDLKDAVEAPLERLIEHLNKVRPPRHPEATGLADLPASRFDEVVTALREFESKKKRAAEPKGAA